MWDQVDPSRRIWGLTLTIALNLLRDEARRHPEREVLGVVPDRASEYDVERASLARVELRRVGSAMRLLSTAHRSVLLSELGDRRAVVQRAPDAVKMLRLRARRKLNALLDTASAGGAVLAFKLRRLVALAEGVVARGIPALGDNSGVSAAALVALLGLTGVAGVGGSHVDGTSHSAGSSTTQAPAAGALGTSTADGLVVASTGDVHRDVRPDAKTNGRVPTTPPDAAAEALRVPLPTGDGYVELAGHVALAGKGIGIGNHSNGVPVCVHGANNMVVGCADEPPASKARFKARVVKGSTSHQVDEEIN